MRHAVPSLRRPTRRPVTHAVSRLALAAALVGGSGCQLITGPRTEKIELTLPSPTLAVGQTMTATASTQKKDGTPRNRPHSFRSSNNAIATITSAGLVTGIAPGKVAITATSDGKSDTDSLEVTGAIATQVQVSPQVGTLRVGGSSVKVVATALDGQGRPLNAGTPQWETSNSSIATVSSDGTVTGLAPGVVNIIATLGGRQGVAQFQVTLLPLQSIELSPNPLTVQVRETRPLAITARDTAGRVVSLAGRTMQFSISDQTVAAVSNAGIVQGLKEGTAIITADIDGVRRELSLTVIPTKVAAVVFNNRNATTRRTGTNFITAFALDSTTNVIPGLVLNYRSTNPAVATVLPNSGLVSSHTLGTTYIVASAGGKADSVLVTVTEIPITQVSVTPLQTTLIGGDSQLFTAIVRDSANNVVTGRPLTWVSSSPLVLAVDATSGQGVALALNGGSATVAAYVDRIPGLPEIVQGTSSVTILPAPVASLAIVPNPLDIPLGGNRTVVVVARDARGNQLLQRSFTLTSANPSIIQVSNQTIVAVGPGTTTITAQAVNPVNGQSDGPPATATVNVISGVAAHRAAAPRRTP